MAARFESVLAPVRVTGVYKVQTACPGIFAWVELLIRPGERAFRYDPSATKLDGFGDDLEKYRADIDPVMEAIEQGVRKRASEGTFGYPLRATVELLRVRYHLVDSRARHFKVAAEMALFAALEDAGALFEHGKDGGAKRILGAERMPIERPFRFRATLERLDD